MNKTGDRRGIYCLMIDWLVDYCCVKLCVMVVSKDVFVIKLIKIILKRKKRKKNIKLVILLNHKFNK